ncbi:MAG: FeoB-associated Cys-rich membrane protein [Sphingobacteriales bacterium]|nr:MAG: FeoB-associated Cys-rich membrane protein [Sphingobacteriales bacterium]
MMQNVLVILLFIAALAYMVRLVWRALRSNKGCASGCAKCKVDFTLPYKQ